MAKGLSTRSPKKDGNDSFDRSTAGRILVQQDAPRPASCSLVGRNLPKIKRLTLALEPPDTENSPMTRTKTSRSHLSRLGVRLLGILWLGCVTACSSGPSGMSESTPSVPAMETELRDILTYESQRNSESRPPVVALTRSTDPTIRALAVRALGRAGGPDNTDIVLLSLGDPDAGVQRQALFALGQTRDRESRIKAQGVLLSKLGSKDPDYLAMVLQALGKLLDESDEPRIVAFLESSAPEVVSAAALALHSIRSRSLRSGTKRSTRSDEILAAALAEALSRKQEPDTEWKLVYTLASLESRIGIDSLIQAATTKDEDLSPAPAPWSRLFAIRGLANLKRDRSSPLDATQDAAFRRILLQSLRNESPLIQVEAALAASDPSRFGRNSSPAGTEAPYQDDEMFSALKQLLPSKNGNVVAAAVLGIGHFTVMKRSARAALEFEMASEDPMARASAVLALTRLLGPAYAPQLALSAKDESWLVRVAVARSLRFLETRRAMPIAKELFAARGKQASNVQIAVLENLATHAEHPASLDLAIQGLDSRDPALRETAAVLLGKIGVPGDEVTLAALRRAFLDSEGFEFSEARQALVNTLAELGKKKPGTRTFLVEAMKDRTWQVRKAAHHALEQDWSSEPVPDIRQPDVQFPPHLPPSGELASFLASRPRLALETSRGRLVIRLWPYEAPGHCYNLLQFIRSGMYDERILHRVVPNFVIQGGDHLGNGYGSRSFSGARIRDEINARPFLQGTLGMPKSAEPDSGGEQIFVCLVPTPHLDGRYTSFGQVVEGLDVLSQLRIGDKLLSCSVLED